MGDVMLHEYEVGRLICGKMREFLKAQKFLGNIDDWHEQKRFLDSVFYIEAPKDFDIIFENGEERIDE